MKPLTALACILTLTTASAFAAGSGYSSSMSSGSTLSFSEVDVDGDGSISAEEASMASLAFSDMDIDNDATVSQEEFEATTGVGVTEESIVSRPLESDDEIVTATAPESGLSPNPGRIGEEAYLPAYGAP